MFWNTRNTGIFYFVIVNIAIILIIAPFFTLLNKSDPKWYTVTSSADFSGTVLEDALKNSEFLRCAHACCIAACLPMAVEILLDHIFQSYKTSCTASTAIFERSLFLLALVIPSILYLIRWQDYIAATYISICAIQNTVLGTMVFHGAQVEMARKSKLLLPLASVSTYLIFIAYVVLRSFILWFQLPHSWEIVADVLKCSYVILAVPTSITWFYTTFRANMRDSAQGSGQFLSFTHDEYRCAIYIIAILSYLVCIGISDAICNADRWENSGEANLISFAALQLAFTVAVTVLPGRIVRMNATQSMEMLGLKQVFVRYVSHEIRSPLNVVHAGLDLLRSELSVCPVMAPAITDLMELVEDMFSASESAINILNDLLNYENLDAGTFNLDMSWKPLLRLLEGKLKWAILLARKKKVELTIVDETVATDAGLNSLLLTERNQLNSIDEDMTSSERNEQTMAEEQMKLVLNVDVHKIDQVIRNLISNAVKFTPTGGSVELKASYKLHATSDTGYVERLAQHSVGVLRIEVKDSGAGIALEDQSKMFGQFSQISRNELQNGGGSGLGLWISRRIVNLHKGRLNFTSEGRGHGCTFFFELPLYHRDNPHVVSQLNTDMPAAIPNSMAPLNGANLSDQLGSVTIGDESAESDGGSIRNLWSGRIGSWVEVQTPRRLRKARNKGSTADRFLTIFSHLKVAVDVSSDGESSDGDRYQSGTNTPQGSTIGRLGFCHKPISPTNAAITPTVLKPSSGDLRRVSYITAISEDSIKASPPAAADSGNAANSEGTLFTRTISRLDMNTRDTSQLTLSDANSSSSLKFLIVDDSDLNRKMLYRLIESDKESFPDCTIKEADDGVTAIELYKEEINSGGSFDFILMDYIMVQMHGPATVAILRGELQYHGVIIGITGNALPSDIAEFTTAGADTVIIKPLTKSKLVDCINAFKSKH
mmetsp:Transcript_9907/g.13587  ORF Transcript_9907/g.13587 Transcript_9907/m.13587 type:complete len:940 (-) Transcript_9907:315-3134(-)